MKDILPFAHYNQNFDHEAEDKNEWLNLHLNMLYFELQQIYTATNIFRAVSTEWDRKVQEKEPPHYSEVRTILYESLVYRIVLGLSKIFSNHKEYSLLKATNQIEQMYRDNREIHSIIKEIRSKLDSSRMADIIKLYRDKFFAHLDKTSVLSYCRIDPTSVMEYVDSEEIAAWMSLIGSLYKVCFNIELPEGSELPSKEDILYTFFWR